MKQIRGSILLVLIAIFVISSCKKPKAYSKIPKISFKSVELKDVFVAENISEKKVILTLQVEDGDGNIGLLAITDTLKEYNELEKVNLFINLYEKINGEYIKVDLELPHNYRTPFLEPEGQQKLLKADIEVSLSYSMPFFNYDTIKYDFFIYDRELNISNIAETPEIPADTIGIITEF